MKPAAEPISPPRTTKNFYFAGPGLMNTMFEIFDVAGNNELRNIIEILLNAILTVDSYANCV